MVLFSGIVLDERADEHQSPKDEQAEEIDVLNSEEGRVNLKALGIALSNEEDSVELEDDAVSRNEKIEQQRVLTGEIEEINLKGANDEKSLLHITLIVSSTVVAPEERKEEYRPKRWWKKAMEWLKLKCTSRPRINLLFNVIKIFCFICSCTIIRGSFVSVLPITFCVCLSIVVLLKSFYVRRIKDSSKARLICDICLFLQILFVLLGFPVFYLSIQEMVPQTRLYDEAFLSADNALLGWIFPEGQLALYADQSSSLNPSTFVGKLTTDSLAIVYFLFYVYIYLVPALVAMKYFWYIYLTYWKKNERKYKEVRRTGQELKHFAVAFSLNYSFLILTNILFPGKSPRIHLKSKYKHDIDGFGIAKAFANISQHDHTSATFPSGHVGQSLVTTIMLVWIWYPYIGSLAFISAYVPILMALATLWLRYHYFIDLVAASSIAVFSSLISIWARRRNGDNGVYFETVRFKPSFFVHMKNSIEHYYLCVYTRLYGSVAISD
jgi:membrane-associated phospholipid phosphatase